MAMTLPKPKAKKKAPATLGQRILAGIEDSIAEMQASTIAVSRAINPRVGTCAGEAIKSARTEEGITIAELADRSGVRTETISRLENGLVKNPTVETLDRLTAAMGRTLTVAVGSSPKKRSVTAARKKL
jgi:ribosome-binding protein aMBF1 (putative translation factor)